MLSTLAPHEPEVSGLQALMEIQASRTPARVDAHGRPVLLMAQDRLLWDRLSIGRGLAALAKAEALCSATRQPPGPYALQAAIAACHARAGGPEQTDWLRICALYDALLQRQPSPVVALNRAVAVSQAHGPAAALPLVQALCSQAQLAQYHLLPSVLADLLSRLGRHGEARSHWLRAAELTRNARERELLLARAHNAQPEGGIS
jgi:predicted RNA polymerase sigma factor